MTVIEVHELLNSAYFEKFEKLDFKRNIILKIGLDLFPSTPPLSVSHSLHPQPLTVARPQSIVPLLPTWILKQRKEKVYASVPLGPH
jgi:hypothetical protein